MIKDRNIDDAAAIQPHKLMGAGLGPVTGEIFYVGTAETNAYNWLRSRVKKDSRLFTSLDTAVGHCVANRGDIIIVAPGHVEPVIAAGSLDLDVAGITVFFMGEGSDKAYINFTTAVSADMDVDAANITLVNPKFIAGIDALTGPIDVNATDFTIINGEYHDATDLNTTDAIIATAGATRLCIDGWKYFKSNEGGTQKESHIQVNGVDDLILRNLHIEGDFDTAIIENVTNECLRMTMEDHFLKNTDAGNGPCATLDTACSGWARRLNWRNADGTVVDSNADINWAGDALGYGTDGYGGDPIGTGDTGGLEGKIDVIDEMVEQAVSSATAVIVTADTLFTIAGGPIQVESLISVCATLNDNTASTLQYSHNPTSGAATTFSGASASLADAAVGASVVCQGTTLATAPVVNASGAGINASGGISIILQAGVITAVVGVGSTTGTWTHYLRYKPLASGVSVS